MYLFVRGNPLSYIDPMGLCAQDTPEWNHLLPDEVFKNLDIDGLDSNSSEFGIIMEMQDHRGRGGQKKVHNKWNKDWDDWVKNLRKEGKEITSDMVQEKLAAMKKEPIFKRWLSSGKKATMSKSKWSGSSHGKTGRADWWAKNRPSDARLLANRRSFSRLAKTMGYLSKAGKIAKPLAVLGTVYAVFIEGVPVAEAGIDALMPPGMSVQGVNNAIGVGQEAFSNVVDGKQSNISSSKAGQAGGSDNLEDYASILRRGG